MIRFIFAFSVFFSLGLTGLHAQQAPAKKANSAKAITQKTTAKLKSEHKQTKANSIQTKSVTRMPQAVGSSQRQATQLNIATKVQLIEQRKRIMNAITELNKSGNVDPDLLKKYQNALDQTNALIDSRK